MSDESADGFSRLSLPPVEVIEAELRQPRTGRQPSETDNDTERGADSMPASTVSDASDDASSDAFEADIDSELASLRELAST